MGGVPEGWAEPAQVLFGWSLADEGVSIKSSWWDSGDMWMLGDPESTGTEYTMPTTGGIAGWITALSQSLPTSYRNPYADAEVYDPFAPTEPLPEFQSFLKDLVQDFGEHITFEEQWTRVKDLIEEDLTEEYEQLAQEYATAHEREMNTSYGRIARTFASFNAVAQTGLMRAAMELEMDHTNMVAQKELELKLAGLERENTFLPTLMSSMNQDRAVRMDAAKTYLTFCELWMTNKRSQFEEAINLALQDDLWTLNLYDYSTKVMSGFNGAPVIGAGPNKFMSALSQVTGTAASAVPVVEGLYKLFK